MQTVACSVEIPFLAAVLPADADSFGAHEERVRLELEAAGAGQRGEGEIRAQLGPWRTLKERPFVSIALVPSRTVSIAASRYRRALDILRTFFEIPRARRHLAKLGYTHLATQRWRFGHSVDIGGCGPPSRRFSTRASVAGSLVEDYVTILDRSLVLASDEIGVELHPKRLAASDSLVAICESAVLRLSLRPAKRLLLAYTALKGLEQRLPPALRQLVPRPLAEGECGPYLWSLEEKVDGAPACGPLSSSLAEQAFDFLSLFAESGEQTGAATGLVDQAVLLGQVAGRDLGLRLEEAAHLLEERLAPLPRVAGHGDFCAGNLLVEDGRLRGVVDWDDWNASELPLVDFLHLHLLHKRSLRWREWGPALLAVLLPFARAGGDERAHDYCRGLGIELDRDLLEQLVWAYWIRRAARQAEYQEWRDDRQSVDTAIRKIAAVFLDSRARR